MNKKKMASSKLLPQSAKAFVVTDRAAQFLSNRFGMAHAVARSLIIQLIRGRPEFVDRKGFVKIGISNSDFKADIQMLPAGNKFVVVRAWFAGVPPTVI